MYKTSRIWPTWHIKGCLKSPLYQETAQEKENGEKNRRKGNSTEKWWEMAQRHGCSVCIWPLGTFVFQLSKCHTSSDWNWSKRRRKSSMEVGTSLRRTGARDTANSMDKKRPTFKTRVLSGSNSSLKTRTNKDKKFHIHSSYLEDPWKSMSYIIALSRLNAFQATEGKVPEATKKCPAKGRPPASASLGISCGWTWDWTHPYTVILFSFSSYEQHRVTQNTSYTSYSCLAVIGKTTSLFVLSVEALTT